MAAAAQGSFQAPPIPQPLPAVEAHLHAQPLAPVHAPVNNGVAAALLKHAQVIADTHHVALETIRKVVEQIITQPNPKEWVQITVDKRKFLVHKLANNPIPEVYLRDTKLGEGSYTSAEKIVSLNTGASEALKLRKKNANPEIDKKMIEQLNQSIRMITYLNSKGRQQGLPGPLPYEKPIQFTDENNVSQMGWIEELCDGDAKNRPAQTKEEFTHFMSDLTEGLFLFHQEGIHHRDIKLPNIFRQGNHFMYNDWGSSRFSADQELEFIEEHQRYLEELTQENAAESVTFLSSCYTPGHCCQEDWPALYRSFIILNQETARKEYWKIEEAREVFALGATIICALDPTHFYKGIDANDPTIWHTVIDTPNANDPLAEGMRNLTTTMFNRLKQYELRQNQIETIDHMLDESWQSRPSTQMIHRVFHPEHYPAIVAAAVALPAAAGASAEAPPPSSPASPQEQLFDCPLMPAAPK